MTTVMVSELCSCGHLGESHSGFQMRGQCLSTVRLPGNRVTMCGCRRFKSKAPRVFGDRLGNRWEEKDGKREKISDG